MSLSVASEESAVTEADPRTAAPRVWGSDTVRLHDLVWGSRCIEVVRPGLGMEVSSDGPALYLLLDQTTLVDFPTRAALKKMHWASPRALRLRLVMRDEQDFREVADFSEGGFAVKRRYDRPVEQAARAWLTADARLARLWAKAGSVGEATRSLRGTLSRDDTVSMRQNGEVFSTESPEGASRWLSHAVSSWARPNAAIPDIYEFTPGVWVHETVAAPESLRIIPPVWIGRGVELPESGALVGPLILVDDPGLPVPEDVEVPWDRVRSPVWNLPSLVGGGRMRRLSKRAFDVVFSLAALAVTLPLYPVIMLAILIEDGRPVFFAHRRQTLGGKEFPCLKFRTMVRDAEKVKQRLAAANQVDGPQFFIANDPRILRVGKVLRDYQLDELPQFLNVLVGHMSVVGPRPSPDKENQYCPAWREARLSVRPGITGLWQVKRTREAETDFQEWIRYDLEYVQHQSLIGDLRIIFETILGMVRR